tara:strand:+ start:228 stop:605 length:378 start_codon:yes stop_codon:yes gene_type:complete
MSSNNCSICIPRVFSNVTWKQVKDVFEELFGKGSVDRVDLIHRESNDGEKFGRVFVHFRYWSKNPEIVEIKKKLEAGETIKIIYDDPWFWKCSKSTLDKPTWEKPKSKPRFELSNEEDREVESDC